MSGEDATSQRQIQSMVNFILTEAKDKAEEIDAKALQDFNVDRLKHSQELKDKIRGDYNKKRKQADTERAIARSTAINRARLEKIEARQQYLTALNDLCSREMKEFIKFKDRYGRLLQDLIVQGCLKLMEDNVTIRCRKEDEKIVQSVFTQAQTKFAQTIKKECGVNKSVNLTIDSTSLDSNSSGGVVLLCAGNSISVDNTLDTRLKLVMTGDLPALRAMLFPN